MSTTTNPSGSAPTPQGRRYPFEPLERVLLVRLRAQADDPGRVGEQTIARFLGESPQTIRRAKRTGLGRAAAERMAKAAGFMDAFEVWPEILDEDIAALPECETCAVGFVPAARHQRFCSAACRDEAKNARRRLKREPVVCEAHGCSNVIVAPRVTRGARRQRFCSPRCKARVHMKLYRERNPHAVQYQRDYSRRYKADVREARARRAQRREAA